MVQRGTTDINIGTSGTQKDIWYREHLVHRGYNWYTEGSLVHRITFGTQRATSGTYTHGLEGLLTPE